MELNLLGIQQFLLFVGAIILLYAGWKSYRITQKYIKIQEQSNVSLNGILNELRRSNRFLSEMSGIEIDEQEFASPQNDQNGNALNPTKLYVGNIDYSATESELMQFFSKFGQIEFVNIPINRYTGRARGFGFVTFTSPMDAERAIALNGSEFKGRQIQVNFAKERE